MIPLQPRITLVFGALLLAGTTAHALGLAECARTTHISHGGEDMHVDLGEGRVMWRNWWSQEGTSTDYVIVDCAPGEALMFRTAEENIGSRPPFDRTKAALKIVASHESGSRVFATFDRMAEDLDGKARDIVIERLQQEPCACAALYAELVGDKVPFELER